MFNPSKYTTLYFKLIEHFKGAEDGENHHIIPKSLGGTNNTDNICKVPSRVHFILHKLLTKMTDGDNFIKMNYALWRMMNPQTKYHNRKYIISSHCYEKQRLIQKKLMTENNPMKNPEISKKFSHPRPEQSEVAKRRNEKYWETRKRQLVNLICLECKISFATKNTKRVFCSKSCSAKYNHKVRRFGLQGTVSNPVKAD